MDQHFPLRRGEPIEAHLLYPLYAGDALVLPPGTTVRGSVVDLHPDHDRRVHALLGGDFTPLRSPVVSFTEIVLPGGAALPFNSGPASDGAPIFRAVAPPRAQGGFIRRQLEVLLTVARTDLALFLGPGKADRFLQFVYNQLPYHPQRIEKGTAWTIETSAAVTVPAQPAPPSPPVVAEARKPRFWEPRPPVLAPEHHDTGTWMLEANLSDPLCSESTPTGQAITATVVEPIFNPDHTVAVPQGAILSGSVTRARPARSFHRTGVLSFSFNKLQLPNAEAQNVETRLAGADSAQNIALNSEGQAKSAPEDKLSVPLFLALLASRPLDRDGGRGTLRKDAIGGAAGLGLVGSILGLIGRSPEAAAGIGYYGAARAFYERWLAHGQKIVFPRDTHIVVETSARRSAPIKPTRILEP